jgi:hypothetical protein
MNNRRKEMIVVMLAVVIVFSLQLTQASDTIQFSWALLQDTGEGQTALEVNTVPNLPLTSTIQLYLHPESGTYLYVFLLDSSRFFLPLFPASSTYYKKNPPGDMILIPAGRDRFSIVPPAGQEKFYILASPHRLTNLEELIDECNRDPENLVKQGRLFKEVRLQRRKNSKYSQFTEKGTPVSGTRRDLNGSRGASEKMKFIATKVVADGFYSKIIRIDHE